MNQQTPNDNMPEGFFTDYAALPEAFPPTWASTYGHDEYGLFADWGLTAAVQRFRWIHPGTFLMGSPASEAERLDNERQHAVTLSKGFWLGDTPCTQAMWQAISGANPSHFSDKNDSPERPVENVSWHQIQNAFNILNQNIEGHPLGLPTEAQWEYACRAGTGTAFYFGDQLSSDQANFDGNHPYGGADNGPYRQQTTPVNTFLPNAWGLYDMHGNVSEWCQDGYRANYQNDSREDPQGDPDSAERVLRGGSWILGGRLLRSARRVRSTPVSRNHVIGLRLARG